jgi:nickel/cobalt transporter (NiCoT) family protein
MTIKTRPFRRGARRRSAPDLDVRRDAGVKVGRLPIESPQRPAVRAVQEGRSNPRGSTPSKTCLSKNARQPLTAREWRDIGGMTFVVVGLHVVGFVILIAIVAPHHYGLGSSGAFSVGLGLTAYTLGLRHAFDADHISAIDNTTRKFMAERRRPLSIGFYFSLGHSTVVFVLALLFAVGIRALSGPVTNSGSALHSATTLIGTGVSSGFLFIIAALNLTVLVGILHVFRDMRRGHYDEVRLERELNSRGLMYRFYGRFTKMITRSWHMYPLGVLFGLGFDTATEVALLFLAAGAAGAGLPFYAILCLPILFAAGMSLLDTIDGSFMNFAYGWAFSNPVRKVYYNITITGLSVAVAAIVGTIELLGLATHELGLRGAFWSWVSQLNINTIGYVIVGMFIATWAVALLVWHFAHLEERWSTT